MLTKSQISSFLTFTIPMLIINFGIIGDFIVLKSQYKKKKLIE